MLVESVEPPPEEAGMQGPEGSAVPARSRCSRSCRVNFFAVIAPATDVIFTVTAYIMMPKTTPEFGWTAHMPLMICWFRMVYLSILAIIAVCRGSRSNEAAWVETAVEMGSEAFGYIVCMLLGAPCIVRLVSDQPESVSDADTTWFWVAISAGAIFSSMQNCYSLEAVPKIADWSKRRAENRTTARAASENGNSASGLGLELLSGDGAAGAGANSATSEAKDENKKKEDEKPKKPTIKKLLQLVAHEWPLLIQASIFLFLAAIMEALIPYYIGEICSSIIKGEENGTLETKPYQGPAVALVFVGLGCGLCSSCRGATFLWIGCKISARLRQDLFEVLANQEISFFDTTKTGELTSRMTQDCQKVTDQVTLNVNVFLRTLVTMMTTLVFMFFVSPSLTLVAFISVPVIAVISKKYGKFQQKLGEQTQKSLADANAVAEEGLSTMSTVRMFAAERLESKRFGAKLVTFVRLQQRQARFYIVYLTLTMSLPNFTTALLLCYGGKLAMHKQIESSRLLAFVFYLQTLNGSFSTLGDFYSNIVAALGAATRIFELLERESKLPLEPSSELAISGDEAAKGRGALKLVDIHFTYPARPDVKVLKGLSLEVPAGKTVALVGPSGNGKSTVIGLVKRLYKAEEGQVLLDDMDVWRFSHEAFHRNISIVGQEPVLYARTIRENITYGITNPKAVLEKIPGCVCRFGAGADDADDAVVVPDADVESAARTANAHAFITAMPEGYDTEVGERGVQLSGGQKQRIAIARALVRKPRVLLLDEATSALDAESERQVQQAIDGMIVQGQMTVVIIAHRLSTVKNSHKICVVQGGVVVEEGPHDELVERRGAYYNLVQSQLSGSVPSVAASSSSEKAS